MVARYGMMQSYVEYLIQIKEQPGFVSSTRRTMQPTSDQFICAIEGHNVEMVDAIMRLLINKSPKQFFIDFCYSLFVSRYMIPEVYAELYETGLEQVSTLMLHYLLSDGAPNIMQLDEHDSNCIAIVNSFIWSFRHTSENELGRGYRRSSQIYNLAFLMGCGTESNLKLMFHIEVPLPNNEERMKASRLNDMVKKVAGEEDGRWWNIISQCDPKSRKKLMQSVTQTVCALIDPTEMGQPMHGVEGVLTCLLVTIGMCNLLNLNNIHVNNLLSTISL